MSFSRSIFNKTSYLSVSSLPFFKSVSTSLQRRYLQSLSKLAYQLQEPKMETPTQEHPSHICSVVPPFLLSDILKHDGLSSDTRTAIKNTLRHVASLHDVRNARLRAVRVALNDGPAVPVEEVPKEPQAPEEPKAPEPIKKKVYREIFDSKKSNRKRKVLVYKEGGDTAAFKSDINATQVHDFFGKSYSFYSEVFGRHSIDDDGLPLIASVHYDDIPGPPGMDNAFWDGDEMAFGDGDGEIFGSFTNNIDVIGHELTHGVIQHTAGLEYEYQAGALNESLADVFGTMIKQYHHPDGKQLAVDADWLIGEGIFLPTLLNATALRSMKAPGTAYNNPKIGKDRQPADMDKYAKLPNTSSGDWGGVHINSGIPNRAFYLVATELGGYSWEKAGQIWYAAMKDPALRDIDTKTAFVVFADLTCKYALDLYEKDIATVVKNAWKKVKVYRSAAADSEEVDPALA